ncbi:MAG: AGE family epimerase/isomerase [Phycisphaeraceae bacterium]
MILDDPKPLRKLYADALLNDVIPFWERHSPDRECGPRGGYFTCLDRQGNVFDTDKFIWLQARQVWMFSKFHNVLEARPQWLEMAASGARFLADHGRDDQGDWYFALTRQGRPLVAAYNVFSDCFAAMAFAEFGRASGQAWATELGASTFQRILDRWDNPKGKYNKLVPGTRPMRSMVLPMITVNLAMELGQGPQGVSVEQVVRDNLTTIMSTFVDRKAGLIFEHVAPDGSHPDTFDGRLINPGHGIECMWFVMAAAGRLGDTAMIELAADALLDQLQFGWDEQYGGIQYFLDAQGKPPQQLEWNQKLWWVHIETLIGLLMGYHLTGRPVFAQWYQRVHDYTWSHFPDPEFGEWYGYLDRRGEVLLPLKGGKWKGCFHVPRGLWMCMTILDQMIADKTASSQAVQSENKA